MRLLLKKTERTARKKPLIIKEKQIKSWHKQLKKQLKKQYMNKYGVVRKSNKRDTLQT